MASEIKIMTLREAIKEECPKKCVEMKMYF